MSGCGRGGKPPECMGSAVHGPAGCTCPGKHDLTDPETKPIYVRYSEHGRNIRKWSFEPFEGATRYEPTGSAHG